MTDRVFIQFKTKFVLGKTLLKIYTIKPVYNYDKRARDNNKWPL